TFGTVYQLPLMHPEALSAHAHGIVARAQQLYSLEASVELRNRLRAELDSAFFQLYGVDRNDVDYIMDTFPIVKRKEEAEFGEYRTKRTILEIFDAMTEAQVSGRPYKSPTGID